MPIDKQIKKFDATQLAASGCLVSTPIILLAAVRYAFKFSESKQLSMAHQVEEVEIEGNAQAELSQIPPEESLSRLVATLRRITIPFEKTGARFERHNYDNEKKKLDSIKKRFADSENKISSASQELIAEAEQLLARYAPNT